MSVTRPSEASRLGVLFVCSDNARRSLIAEALMRDRCATWARGFSAGISPADGADPRALSAITLAGLDNAGLWPKHWEGFSKFSDPIIDVIVMLDPVAAEALPRVFPGNPEYWVWENADMERPSADTYELPWQEIQWLRPKVNALVEDLSAMQEFCLARQPLAAE